MSITLPTSMAKERLSVFNKMSTKISLLISLVVFVTVLVQVLVASSRATATMEQTYLN